MKSNATLARVATLVAIPILMALERSGYYAVRSVLRLYLRDPPGTGLGLPAAEVAGIFGTWTLAMILCVLIGGVVAFAAGPRIPLIAGMALSAAGYALLGNGGAGALWPALLLVALGQGLAKTSALGVLAQELGRGLDNLRTAACLAMFGAIDVGAFVGGSSARFSMPIEGPPRYLAAFSFATVLLVVGTAVATVLVVILARSGRRPEAPAKVDVSRANMDELNAALLRGGPSPGAVQGTGDAAPAPPDPAKAALGAGLILLVLIPAHLAQATFDNVEFALADALSSSTLDFLINLSTGVSVGVSVLAAAAVFAVSLTVKKPLPVLYGVAAGLILTFLGCMLLIFSGQPASSAVLAVAGFVATVGSILVSALAMAKLLGASERAAPLWAAGWYVLPLLLIAAKVSALDELMSRPILVLSAALCLIAGVLIAALYRPFDRLFAPAGR